MFVWLIRHRNKFWRFFFTQSKSLNFDSPEIRTYCARRKPLLLFLLSGLFLLRLEERQLLSLLFQEPPRNTRCHLNYEFIPPRTNGCCSKTIVNKLYVFENFACPRHAIILGIISLKPILCSQYIFCNFFILRLNL